MAITIENLTNRPVLLRCNSGSTLHIAPKTVSPELPDVEIQGNAKVEKLKGLNAIAVQVVEKGKNQKEPRVENKKKR